MAGKNLDDGSLTRAFGLWRYARNNKAEATAWCYCRSRTVEHCVPTTELQLAAYYFNCICSFKSRVGLKLASS